MPALYIDIEKSVCDWTQCLIEDGFVAPGDVWCCSIKDIHPDELKPYTQIHACCGISVWSYALRQAGWSDERPIVTASLPCQPFSVAGKQAGEDDPRHLWPDFFRLVASNRPPVIMGEQVSGKAGRNWFDGVASDLESENYACGAIDVPACSVDAPHQRNRLYWVAKSRAFTVAHREVAGLSGRKPDSFVGQVPFLQPTNRDDRFVEHSAIVGRGQGRSEPVLGSGGPTTTRADASSTLGNTDRSLLAQRQSISRNSRTKRSPAERANDASFWADSEWIACHDGKQRRAQRGLSLLVAGTPQRIPMWRALGNAICAPLAIEVIKAFLESEDAP